MGLYKNSIDARLAMVIKNVVSGYITAGVHGQRKYLVAPCHHRKKNRFCLKYKLYTPWDMEKIQSTLGLHRRKNSFLTIVLLSRI